MRINVYSQELILDPSWSEVKDSDGQPMTKVELFTQTSNTNTSYSAVRMFLNSSDRLHHPPQDDDRSAITFWLPKSAVRRQRLADLFIELARLTLAAPPETGLD